MPPQYFFPLIGMGFVLAWGVIGTTRWYLQAKLDAETKRHEFGTGNIEEIHALEARIAELEERVDFHERVIDGQRKQLESGQ